MLQENVISLFREFGMNMRNFQANASPISVSDHFLEVTNKKKDLLDRNKHFLFRESVSL